MPASHYTLSPACRAGPPAAARPPPSRLHLLSTSHVREGLASRLELLLHGEQDDGTPLPRGSACTDYIHALATRRQTA